MTEEQAHRHAEALAIGMGITFHVVRNPEGALLGGVPLPTITPTTQPRAKLSELFERPRMFFETLFIWGGAATAAYGVYLWGPTVIALLQKVPVPQAALGRQPVPRRAG